MRFRPKELGTVTRLQTTSAISLASVRVEVVGAGTDLVGRDAVVQPAAGPVGQAGHGAHLQIRRLASAGSRRPPAADGHLDTLKGLAVVERQASDVDGVGDGRRGNELQDGQVVVFGAWVVVGMVHYALNSDENFSVTSYLRKIAGSK